MRKLSPAHNAGANLPTALHPPGPDWLEATCISIEIKDLPETFDGFRIVHLSDLHFGTWLDLPRISQVVAFVNDLEPDVVAITGDFVNYNAGRRVHELVPILARLTPRVACLGVLGNHDVKAGAERVVNALQPTGIQWLRNSQLTIRRQGQSLHIAGIDSWYYRQDRLDSILDEMGPTGPAVLLAHEPDFADQSASTGRFALQLSGHSHGGQIVFPRLGPLYLPRGGIKYPEGLYRLNGMLQYTNRGLGTSHVHLRVNCPPEVGLVTLRLPGGGNDAVPGYSV